MARTNPTADQVVDAKAAAEAKAMVDAGAQAPAEAEVETQLSADASSVEVGGMVMIWPVRSYLDGSEIRRRGGSGYLSPRHDAVSLIAAKLATDKDPEA